MCVFMLWGLLIHYTKPALSVFYGAGTGCVELRYTYTYTYTYTCTDTHTHTHTHTLANKAIHVQDTQVRCVRYSWALCCLVFLCRGWMADTLVLHTHTHTLLLIKLEP